MPKPNDKKKTTKPVKSFPFSSQNKKKPMKGKY